jgi:hypothetical protein
VTPRVRSEALLLQELPDETLVYDQRAHRAHCLNRIAAEVFRLADGSRSVPELAEALGEKVGSREPELVWAALDELGRADLLEQAPAQAVAPRSRRAALRRLGLGALLPTVISVLAPTPAEALATCVEDCTGQAFGTPCSPTIVGDCAIDASGICDGAGSCL